MTTSNKTGDDWNVLPHGPLQKTAENLWVVEGSVPHMPLGRVMTVARMSDGHLVIHNAIALEAPLMEQIEAWGEPAFLVVPSGWHRMDAPAYKRRYPKLQVVCPAAARRRVAQAVPVDQTYDDFAGDETVQLSHIEGVARREGVLQVRSDDGVSLAFNDLLFNAPHQPGLFGLVFRLFGSTGGPKVTRVGRLLIVKDKAAVRSHLQQLAATEGLTRVIVMHGQSVSGDAAAQLLQTVADRL